MRLSLILPPVQPERYPAVTHCPYAGCDGEHYRGVRRSSTRVRLLLGSRLRMRKPLLIAT